MRPYVSAVLEGFFDLFEVRLASTSYEIAEAQRLRYQVYCEERAMANPQDLAPEDFLKRQEADAHDPFSHHCVVAIKRTAALVGCVRVITTDRGRERLPLQIHCGESLYNSPEHPIQIGQEHICEISRFAIPRNAKNLCDDREGQFFPSIGTALKVAPLAVMNLIDTPDAYVMMKPALARMLNYAGLNFRQVGHLIDYHGQRAAYHITHTEAIDGMKADLQGMYDAVHHGFSVSELADNIRPTYAPLSRHSRHALVPV